MSEEMIDVIVTATQRVEYIQHRKIPKSLFDKYEAMCDRGAPEHEFDRDFEYLIDTTEVYDAGELKDVEIRRALSPATWGGAA